LIAVLAAFNGLLAVAVGAFGAHGIADPQAKAWIATGAAYGLGHAVAALVVEPRSQVAAWAMSLGALVFSVALYLIAVTGLRWLGMVAPVGGVLMLGGWALFLFRTLRAL
jgi:uncharacterized membrane protein YgdD (TMEM256/DUF423 family)